MIQVGNNLSARVVRLRVDDDGGPDRWIVMSMTSDMAHQLAADLRRRADHLDGLCDSSTPFEVKVPGVDLGLTVTSTDQAIVIRMANGKRWAEHQIGAVTARKIAKDLIDSANEIEN